VNRAGLREEIDTITGSVTVIKGNAKLAFKSERPKWVDRYLSEIINEANRLEDSIKKIEQLCAADCYSAPVSSGSL